jgi:hypothetical protein
MSGDRLDVYILLLYSLWRTAAESSVAVSGASRAALRISDFGMIVEVDFASLITPDTGVEAP